MSQEVLPHFDEKVLDRMVRAWEIVRERLLTVTSILDRSEIPYAVVGGNAIAYWVATVKPGAVRGTPDQNILLRRNDVPAAIATCLSAGLSEKEENGRQYIRFDDEHSDRDATWFLIANEKHRESNLFPTPDVMDSIRGEDYRVIDLLPLLNMKLTAYRTIDRVHLRDLLNVDVTLIGWGVCILNSKTGLTKF